MFRLNRLSPEAVRCGRRLEPGNVNSHPWSLSLGKDFHTQRLEREILWNVFWWCGSKNWVHENLKKMIFDGIIIILQLCYFIISFHVRNIYLFLSLSMSLTHTHLHFNSDFISYTPYLSQFLSLIHTHFHTHTVSLSVPLSQTHSHTHTHSLSHSISDVNSNKKWHIPQISFFPWYFLFSFCLLLSPLSYFIFSRISILFLLFLIL